MFITADFVSQSSPRSEVAPGKGDGMHKDFFRFFHDGIIDRDALTLGEVAVDARLLLGGVIDRKEIFKDGRNRGFIDTERIDDGADAPNEDAGVPQIVRELHVGLCGGKVRFLGETIHTENAMTARGGKTEVCFDVAIARFRTSRLHSQRDECIGFCGEGETLLHDLFKSLCVRNEMVSRRHHDVGARVALLDFPTDVADGGRGVSSAGLSQHLFASDVGKLFIDKVHIARRSEHPNVFFGHEVGKTLCGQLEQRLTTAKNVQKLLRFLFRRQRPEAASHATCQNH